MRPLGAARAACQGAHLLARLRWRNVRALILRAWGPTFALARSGLRHRVAVLLVLMAVGALHGAFRWSRDWLVEGNRTASANVALLEATLRHLGSACRQDSTLGRGLVTLRYLWFNRGAGRVEMGLAVAAERLAALDPAAREAILLDPVKRVEKLLHRRFPPAGPLRYELFVRYLARPEAERLVAEYRDGKLLAAW